MILASKEENVREQIEGLTAPVWVSDVKTLDEAIQMIVAIGEMTKSNTQGEKIIKQIDFSLFAHLPKIKVAYLIWRKPYMTIGGDTFINELLDRVGFENVFAEQKRYPVVSLDEIKERDPKYIFLSTEPFPFKEKFFKEFEHITTPILVDGEMFSWFGSRLTKASSYFAKLNRELGR